MNEDQRKKMRVKVQSKLVVGYCGLISLESGADNSAEQDTCTFTKEIDEPPTRRNVNLLWKEWNWQRLKKAMNKRRNPAVNEVCDEYCLELGEDSVPLQTVANFL